VIDQAAFASKGLYNAANYVIRQTFINAGVYLCYEEMHARMKSSYANFKQGRLCASDCKRASLEIDQPVV
jgi:hypothetical protein